jgi:hypothetical protein
LGRRLLPRAAGPVVVVRSTIAAACLALLALSTWAGCQLAAAEQRDDTTALGAPIAADELVHRLGLDRQVDALADLGEVWEENIRRAIAMAAKDQRPPAAESDRALRFSREAAAGAYERKTMLASIEAVLADAPAEVLEAIGAYLRSPASEEVALVRAHLSTGAGQQRLARFLALLRGTELQGAFLARLERWMAAEKELALLMVIVWEAPVRYGAQVTAAARAPTLGALFEAQVRDSFKLSLNVRLRQQTAYLIQSLPPATVDAHLAFWESDAGAWLARARIRAVERALAQAHATAAERLQAAADAEPWTEPADAGPEQPDDGGGVD